MENKPYDIMPLITIMEQLLGPDGCPWDKEQTHHSLKRNLLEETHEVIETIDNEDFSHLKEELGDLLLQIVFHTQLAEKEGHFDFNEVVTAICDKLVRRHPHIFAQTGQTDSDTVLKNWEQIKLQEKGGPEKATIMSDLPPTLPALLQAEKVQEKARRVGFDWTDVAGAWQKVAEEIEELKQAQDSSAMTEELGDVLFSLVNVSRFLHIDAEEALKMTVKKFIKRFNHMEAKAMLDKKPLASYTIEELDEFWDEAKAEEKAARD